MKKKIFVIFLFFFLFSFFFSFQQQIQAQVQQQIQAQACPSDQPKGLVPCGRDCNHPDTDWDDTQPCQFCDFFVLFKNIYDFVLFKIVTPVAVLMVAIGGFMLIFAHAGVIGEGGPGMVGKAKSVFTSVAIGLVIIFGAWVIINTFFQLIGVADWTGLKGGWWTINCQ